MAKKIPLLIANLQLFWLVEYSKYIRRITEAHDL